MTHTITVCTSCKDENNPRAKPGEALIDQLQTDLPDGFAVRGVNCMAGCKRPCAVAYQAPNKASYLFGDLAPGEDVADLVAFAQQYAELEDGWCSSKTRPGKLKTSTLARVPALPKS